MMGEGWTRWPTSGTSGLLAEPERRAVHSAACHRLQHACRQAPLAAAPAQFDPQENRVADESGQRAQRIECGASDLSQRCATKRSDLDGLRKGAVARRC